MKHLQPPDPEPSPRGRPRGFDRQAALEAALHLFWQHGYDATSLADLTAAMGISPPSLYAAFGSKKGLFLEAVDLYASTHGASTARAFTEEPTAHATIRRMLLEMAAVFSDPAHPTGCFIVLGATNCVPASADIVAALRDRRIANEKLLRERIVRGIREGELPAGTDAAALAKFYGAIIQGMSIQARDGASRAELEEVARRALDAWPPVTSSTGAPSARQKPAARTRKRKPATD
ncbi:TetR/AcrR family transcriptional regulator [Chondromyces crocatus]|uniref:TetR family transcriptional regulator n=1 Tax=Chondromyces crocatus TaxID=52 RepID=A0A0K1ERX6_CHOCO|nr:TetR/AcrR family transcriptional regulator [Chondromyces crocatus]AKT43601.1 TetR family transcriptional regulator [Chondromyces crocatus]